MFVYTAVVVVVAVMLVASYRALAGGEVLVASEYRTVLRSLAEFTGHRAAELRNALETPAPAEGADDPINAVATACRKKFAAYQQQLSRFEGGMGEDCEAARTALSMAIENLGWACRMSEPGTYRSNPGVQAAVAMLREHGERCLAHSVARLE